MELSKNYTPGPIESKWYATWMEKGYFKSTPDQRPAYSIVIPPPNVTGVLHMGHTLNETVQDILIRKARMSGYNVCWVPGSDHASIATEARVVNMLKNEKGINKNDLSRQEFLEYAFEWKEKYGNIIYNQIERLGCSVDWDRVSFTMDEHYYKAVIKVFVDLYNKGKLYRGARMINWDTVAKTALSDEEVEYKDETGKLYYIKYMVADGEGEPGEHIIIATQRPETIMGDVAVCANPDDARYTNLNGKQVIVPLIDRKVPVIFDSYVDKDFGTGVLKITPAHDINDYNIGLKHNLEVVDTLNEDGTLSKAAQIYIGEDRYVARKKIVAELKEKGYLVKEEEYTTRLGYSQRTNSVAEPKISTQWFVKMKELAEPALEEVLSGNIHIHPKDKFTATYKYWLENVKDWCISRQLWWGQQIPAWYDEEGRIYVAETEEEAIEMAKKANGTGASESLLLTRDEDVLDTWFSSWLWPIEVFKGITQPHNEEINYYYPTSVLVTGQDIIFFWVARMIMAGMEYMHEAPFADIYFTGMVRDKEGRKMSKSLGNSPDLLDLIDQYGADAVRFGIMISSPAGNDLLFDESSLEQGKHFNNKIWNALKLVKMWEGKLHSTSAVNDGTNSASEISESDHFALSWFENRMNEVKNEVEILIKQFRLSEALKTIYSLIWDDFCSWFLEWVKPEYGQAINGKVYKKTVHYFDDLLQLLHPFMPFITEEIFHLLKDREEDLIVKQFAPVFVPNESVLLTGQKLKDLITAVRDTRNKINLKPKETISVCVDTTDEKSYSDFKSILMKQVNAEKISFNEKIEDPTATLVIGNETLYVNCDLELDPVVQREKLLKDLNYYKGFLTSVEKKLSNERFMQNAKPEIINLETKKKQDAEEKISLLENSLAALK